MTPAATARSLVAGALSVELQGLDIVDVRVGTTEVVRRIGVRVRDPNWETVVPTVRDLWVHERSNGFVGIACTRHQSGSLDFSWRGLLTGESDGSLVYEMSGRALSSFDYGRIGICVLHPPSVAGRPFRAKTPGGPIAGRLPKLIAPQRITAGTAAPLVPAFTALEIDVVSGLTTVFEFEGELFELEDQRNWSDGSFKTYSTPVGLPTPFRAEPGHAFRQRVRIRMAMSSPARPRRATRAEEPVRLRLGRPLRASLPPIGLGLDSDGYAPDARTLALLHALAPAHVRADVDVDRSDAADLLDRAGEVAAAMSAQLELVLLLGGPEAAARRALGLLATPIEGLPLARLIIFQRDEWVTAERWLSLAREALSPLSGIPLATGTNFHFAELNRDRPAPGIGDGLVYSVTPQVHDVDDAALVHSLEAQGATVKTARTFAAGRPVHVSPVTLKPRHNPYASGSGCHAVPAGVDERQASLFAAAWTVGSIKHLAEAGAASITYFELTGSRGITGRPARGCQPEPFPVYHVLGRACAWCGQEVVSCSSSSPQAVEALAVKSGRALHGLVANLTPRRQTIVLGPCEAEWAAVRVLDDTGSVQGRLCRGELELEVNPYAVAGVEFQERRTGKEARRPRRAPH